MRVLLSVLFLCCTLPASFGQPAPTPAPMLAAPAPQKQPEWPKELGGKDLKGWLAELKDSPDGSMREAASKAIPHFGPSARKESLQPLIDATKRETDPGVKVNLLMDLGNIGSDDAAEARKLVEVFALTLTGSPKGSPYKLHAARGLANYAPDATSAISELIQNMDDSSWETRQAVARTLGLIGRPNDKKKTPTKQALDAVSKRIHLEKSVPVRLELVQAMVVMGAPNVTDPNEYAAAIAPYFKIINDQLKDEKDKAIQVWLRLLVMQYDGSQLTEASIKKIADYVPAADIGGRIAALRALALLDDRAKPFVPVMIDALKSDDQVTVVEAMSALAALEEDARSALPALEAIKATNKDEGIKAMAGMAIERINAKKPAAAPPVKKP